MFAIIFLLMLTFHTYSQASIVVEKQQRRANQLDIKAESISGLEFPLIQKLQPFVAKKILVRKSVKDTLHAQCCSGTTNFCDVI